MDGSRFGILGLGVQVAGWPRRGLTHENRSSGNPYAVSTFPGADAHLVAYDQTIASVRATAGVLQGEQWPRGRLPITVEPYEYGAGRSNLGGTLKMERD
jgi:hypothetical protein